MEAQTWADLPSCCPGVQDPTRACPGRRIFRENMIPARAFGPYGPMWILLGLTWANLCLSRWASPRPPHWMFFARGALGTCCFKKPSDLGSVYTIPTSPGPTNTNSDQRSNHHSKVNLFTSLLTRPMKPFVEQVCDKDLSLFYK